MRSPTFSRIAAIVPAAVLATLLAIPSGCSKRGGAPAAPPSSGVALLRSFPMDGVETVIQKDAVEFDPEVSRDGRGSVRAKVAGGSGPVSIRLFETGDLDLEGAMLSYSAALRAEGLEGKAYLEMWCVFPGQGEFFSRGLDGAVSGTTEWATVTTPFFLQAGQDPNNVRLNLVVEGTGTVWIDEVKLERGPLP